MRIIVVLILTAALAWVFLKLFPSTNETLAAVGGTEVAGGPVAGNSAPTVPSASERASAPSTAQREPALLPAAAPEPPERPDAAAPAAGAVDRLSPEESALGALLAHGHLAALEQQLQRPGSRLSEPRRAMLLSFVEAMTGRRDNGLERAQGPGVASSASAREQELLRVALGLAPYPPSAAAARPAPVERGLEMVLAAQSAERASVEGRAVVPLTRPAPSTSAWRRAPAESRILAGTSCPSSRHSGRSHRVATVDSVPAMDPPHDR